MRLRGQLFLEFGKVDQICTGWSEVDRPRFTTHFGSGHGYGRVVHTCSLVT